MAEHPMFPLWTDAYLADTSHLTTIEHGAYLLLMMAMWRTREKRLPDDDKQLCRFCRLTPAQWARIKPTIMPFFDAANGYITQARLMDEAEAVRQHSKRQSDKAKARWLKSRHPSDAAAMPERCPLPTSLVGSESSTNSEDNNLPSEREGGSRGYSQPTLAFVNGNLASVPSPQAAPAAPDPPPRKRSDQGTRLDPDWEPGTDGVAYARQHGFDAEAINRMFEDFQDTFLAKSGQNSRKTSWPRTWKRWVRTEHDRVREKERRDQQFRDRYQVAARR